MATAYVDTHWLKMETFDIIDIIHKHNPTKGTWYQCYTIQLRNRPNNNKGAYLTRLLIDILNQCEYGYLDVKTRPHKNFHVCIQLSEKGYMIFDNPEQFTKLTEQLPEEIYATHTPSNLCLNSKIKVETYNTM